MSDPATLIGLLADENRLRVFAAIALGARTVDEIAQREEREVNELLRGFHDDTASLRRYLVDEGLLERQAGVYRRA